MQNRLLNALYGAASHPVLIVLSQQDAQELEKEFEKNALYSGVAPGGLAYKTTFNGVPFAIASVHQSFILAYSKDGRNDGLPEMHAIP